MRTVARVDHGLGGEAVGERADGVEQRVPVAAGEVDAADGAREEQVAAEERAARVVGDVAGAVARDVDDLELDPRDGDGVAAGDEVLRLVGADVPAAARDPRAEDVGLPGRRLNLGARLFREVGDGADVVDVGVRDEDRAYARAGARELEPQLRGGVARVDDEVHAVECSCV